ncbi:glycoside hydrolase family 92 protein [Rhodocytophaga rosea]|uniref:Glycoside hydrolase family 92 protein n=2 Tax=Rhodocytophaga rosea TaxID=2704465 RepID=A0A6C0GVI9_9BACT|nr:glycoside hydrolase family 92 protein [Rhodocytophaga rosea]
MTSTTHNLIGKLIFTVFTIGINSHSLFAGVDNIAHQAKVTVSSELNSNFKASGINDGIIGIHNKGEWACEGETAVWGYIRYPWVQLEWTSDQIIDKVILYDRVTLDEHIAGGTLEFSDGSKITVTAIPNEGSAKLITFPPKTVKWIRFTTTDGIGKHVGLSEIEVFPAPQMYPDYVSWVNPFIETTRGRYFFFVTGSRPFGMISAAPVTRNKNQWGGGYNYNSTEILGFGQIHCWMLSGLNIMPTTGAVDPTKGEKAWKSQFSHDDEIAQPGYHRLFLRDYKTWVEQTSTDRVSFYRFRYTEATQAQILTNLGGHLGGITMKNATVTKVNPQEIEGSFSTVDRLWGGPKDVKIFFVARFDKPFKSVDGWKGKTKLSNISTLQGDSAGVAILYDVAAGDTLQMKISTSYTSIENARKNMITECDHWDFNQVRNDARREWNQWLGKIDVKGGTPEQKIKFYTDLWHVLLGRHKLNDVSGDYPDYTQGKRIGTFTEANLNVRTLPKDKNGKVKYNMYNSDAFWLTQWNLNILWGLGWPGLLDDFSASLIQYADNGGLLPRGPNAGGYSYIMTGCPATNLIVSTYMKGLLKKAQPAHAFEVMKRNHLPGGMMAIGKEEDLEFYTKNGWCPGNAGITVEWAFQDWSLAQMAGKLGKKKEKDYFLKRSEGWKTCFNPQQGLLFPRAEDGKWAHNDPLSGAGWIEANAWQGTWGVSHDIGGLSKLMGGNDTLCHKLNYANQPGCSNAHVFNYAGKPWLSQYWVRKVQGQAYGGITPDKGYGGHDEDQGQMGGVSALMAIGLFSLQGNTSSTPLYEITSPIFDEITIQLDPNYYSGKQFVIKTYNNSQKNCYIQKAQLNGKPLNNCWFTHSDFAQGGLLEIWLGPEPNRKWGTTNPPTSQLTAN